MFGSFWLLESISFGFMSPQRAPGLLLFTLLAHPFLQYLRPLSSKAKGLCPHKK